MKNLLFLLVFVTSSCFIYSQENQIKNFDSLMESLNNGKDVKAVIHYAKCKLIIDSVETEAPEAIGGMLLNTFEYFAKMSINNPKAFVTTSETVLITHRKRGFVYNYVKIKIYDDNKVEIIAKYLLPNTLEVVMDETFYAEINDGSNDQGVFLYAD